MESEVGNRVQFGQHSSPRARNARLPVISSLRFSKILRLEIIYMNYDVKQSGERIRQLRIRDRLSQEQVAGKLNIDRSFYSRIEAGKSGCSVDLFVQLSDLFKVSLDYLILGSYSVALFTDSEKMLLKEDIENLVVHLEQIKEIIWSNVQAMHKRA